MQFKRFLGFAGKATVVHAVTCFIAGSVAYYWLTKEFYVGPDAIFATFMRTEAEPELWGHVVRWFLPAQLLRGALIGCALYPFFETLLAWPFRKRFLAIAGLYIVLGFWAATVAAPGTIEGMVYMRPPIDLPVHLKVQPEIVGQGLLLGAWLAGWMVTGEKAQGGGLAST